MNTIAIVQARMGSTRLPNKVMLTINGTPMIQLLLLRLSQAKNIDRILVATSDSISNQSLVKLVRRLGYDVFLGSENDVLDRYYQAAKSLGPKIVVRITGDCPLIDPTLVDQIVLAYRDGDVDYMSNTLPPSFPDGLDTEVFSFRALEKAAHEATAIQHREHVTPYIRESGFFKTGNFFSHGDYSDERWTVDEAADFRVVQSVFNHFYPRVDFGWKEILDLKNKEPAIFQANKSIRRDEGSRLGSGQKLWKRAKTIIPGGNMLLSKRAEMFLPDRWPAYFSKAKGCKVWDLDGNEFIDMSIMGIGTNTLGYGHPEVDRSVREIIGAGNMSTLNCPEEVYLAEKLVELHPWADMARFARSGGEANAIAIRIARAAAGREKVAICGYHGWHDWYLSTNLNDVENLSKHLLPGLEPKGVPQSLRNTVFSFEYNNFVELAELVKSQDIGVIMMEVVRNFEPKDNFLAKVRTLASENNIVLIFDECTSGFRQNFGGLHKIYDVEPDMAMFGKALGNGYAITGIIGRREIMEAAQGTFISSTFWTERIGPAAALKTIEVMERERSWEHITAIGKKINARWLELAKKYQLPITINGLPALTNFSFNTKEALAYKTLITQEMLKKGYLAGTSVYACTEHTQDIIERYFEALDPIFSQINECENGLDVQGLLNGPVCHDGFKRLN